MLACDDIYVCSLWPAQQIPWKYLGGLTSEMTQVVRIQCHPQMSLKVVFKYGSNEDPTFRKEVTPNQSH